MISQLRAWAFSVVFSMCFASKSIWIQYGHQVLQKLLNPIHKYWLLQLQYTLHFHQNELQLGMVFVYLKLCIEKIDKKFRFYRFLQICITHDINLLQIVILESAWALKFNRRPHSLLATTVAARLAVGLIWAFAADSA